MLAWNGRDTSNTFGWWMALIGNDINAALSNTSSHGGLAPKILAIPDVPAAFALLGKRAGRAHAVRECRVGVRRIARFASLPLLVACSTPAHCDSAGTSLVMSRLV
jgi:hypothetical protein